MDLKLTYLLIIVHTENYDGIKYNDIYKSFKFLNMKMLNK